MSEYEHCKSGRCDAKTHDEDDLKHLTLQRAAIRETEQDEIPPVVYDVLRTPGRPLDAPTRAFMEARFEHDFSGVHVHTDAQAAESAQVVNARAYTVGRDVVFGASKYAPHTPEGQRLMAHELTHVVQQRQNNMAGDVETRAANVSQRVMNNQHVSPRMIGSAAVGLYANGPEEEQRQRPRTTLSALRLDWGALNLPHPAFDFSQGTSTPSQTGSEAETPELPSRISVLDRGRFSLGLRLGFPEPAGSALPDAPPSALQESLRRGQILNEILTGNVPSGWDALDKGKLAKAVWGIFSRNIAPDLARNITESVTTPTGAPGLSYQLDLVLLTDFSGGGLNFTIQF